MEKIIKRTISLTTKKRDSRNKLFEEFYSHDKNNAIFEFTVEGGVPTEDIVVLFHFKRTNRHLEVRGRVDNDKIIVNFDTSLIVKDEQVAGYIYYENGEKSNDVYRFMFDVHVSEIDKEHDLPIMELESKRIVPLTDIVTKSEIIELLKKIVANEKLYDDTEIKQQIDLKADKEAVREISSKIEALETRADNDTVYNDAEIRGQIATKADTQAVEAIAKRVETLESKTDNDTVYNDTELREKIEKKADKESLLQYLPKSELTPISEKVQSIETNIDRMATQQQLESYVSKEELGNKGYLTSADTHNFALKSEIPVLPNLDTINNKIRTLEEKPPVDLSHLATKDELEAVRNSQQTVDTSNLVTKSELEDKYYLTEHQNLEGLVTKSELEQKGYLTAHQSLEDYSKKAELDRVTERVQSLEARPQVDTSKLVSKEELEQKNYLTSHQSLENVVTKQELEAKGYLTTHQDLSEYAKKAEIPPQFDSQPLIERIDLLESKAIANGAYNDKPLLDKIHEVQESLKGFITQSSRYLTEHQSLAHLVTKDELASKGYITNHQSLEHLVTKEELESKGYLNAHQSLEEYAKKSEIPHIDTTVFATKEELSVVKQKQDTIKPEIYVTKEELSQKGYLTTHQSLENVVTKSELEQKGYLTNHQDISNLATNSKVSEVENRVNKLENSGFLKAHQDLSSYATKEEVSKKADKEAFDVLKQDVVTHTELVNRNYLTEHQSLENLVTKEELEQKGYLTHHQDISNLVTKQELHEATEIDYSQIVTHEELEAKHYLQNQSLAEYAKKTEIPKIDTSSFVTKQELEAKQYLDNHQSLDGYVKKSELPPQVDTSTLVSKQELTSMNLVNAETLGDVSKKILEQTTKITALEAKSGYEIHGTGMPNERVTAPIGTTYVDTAVTNGALKWIKESGDGNIGWKVLIGDTGWRTLKTQSLFGSSFVKIRRVNNMVSYQFGGLNWGLFGIVRRGGNGFVIWGNNPKVCRLTPNNGIPEGFRSRGSIIGPVYNDNGVIIASWYLGGEQDSNHLRFAFIDNIPTDRDIRDMRVSNIIYLTDDDWATTLP